MSSRIYDEPSLHDIIHVVLRHKKKVMLFGFVSVFSGLFVAVILPAKFASESKLLVLVGRESVGLDPIVSTGKMISMEASRAVEMKTVRDLMRSREVLSKVVDSLGTDFILQPPEDPGIYDHAKRIANDSKDGLKETIKAFFSDEESNSAGAGVSTGRVELAIQSLENSIEVDGSKESSVISVIARARSPKLAQALAATLVEVYTHEHARLHSTAKSEEFFDQQKRLTATQLRENRQRLSELKTDIGIGSIEAEFQRLELEKADLATLRQSLARDMAGSHARCEALEDAINAAEEVVLTERLEGMPNAATEGVRQQLYTLEIEVTKASNRYTEIHPGLKKLRQQLAEMQTQYSEEKEDRTETKFARNLSREALALELDQQKSASADLKAQINVLDEQWENVLANLKRLNAASSELEQLTQDVTFLARNYDTYSDSLEQSRIGSSLNSQQISNINIAQPASYVMEPIGPNRPLIAICGLALAILGAIPLAFATEYFDGRMKSSDEVESVLGIPVIATIPKQANPVKLPAFAGSSKSGS